MEKIKKRKFNLGKLIVLLSCLAVLTAMVTSIAVTKPIKANSAAEMQTASVGVSNNVAKSNIVEVLLDHSTPGNDDYISASLNLVTGEFFWTECSEISVSEYYFVELYGYFYDVRSSETYDCTVYFSDLNVGSKNFFDVLLEKEFLKLIIGGEYDLIVNTDRDSLGEHFTFYSYEMPPNPTKEGHTFEGWYFDSALTRPYDNSPILADTQLYAKFNIDTFLVSFNSVGGSFVANAMLDWNTTPTLATTSKEGYTFLGWFIGETQYTAAPIKSNLSLTAKWEINRYTVTYDSNGGIEVDSVTQDWNTMITLPTLTREGYTFLGWFNGATKYTVAPLTANLNLKAEWELIQYTVTFYVDGKVFTTLKIGHGMGLGAAMAEQGLLFFNVVDAVGNNLGKATTITSEMTFNIAEMTQNEKVGAFIAENDWILWTVGISLVVLIGVVIILITKIKRG